MSVPGGGDITELLRRLGFDAIVNEGERAGLRPRNRRMQCPWVGCQDKGSERKDTAVVYPGKGSKPRLGCHRCGESGDLVDLLQRTQGWTAAEAIAHVQGHTVPEKPRPSLHVVANKPAEHPDKMLPAAVLRLWNSLALDDEAARAYLSKRNLEPAIDAGLVRFANVEHKDKLLSSRVRQGYVIAALASDVVGQPRGIQLRLARKAQNSAEVTIVSVKGSVTSTAFFGEPGLIETALVVAVAEGFADTLALKLWAEERAVVVGGAGKGMLRHLAPELEAAGIDITNKLFVLFPQNDDPKELKKTSRGEFAQVKADLQRRGARVCWVKTPAEYADLADWLKAKPDTTWPPPELADAFDKEPGDEQKQRFVQTPGHALPARAEYTTERYGQNLTTLAALFDDPSSREALLLRRGELSFCKMTHAVLVDGKPLADKELTKVRVELERFARSTDGKPLQFKAHDVRDVLTMLASRHEVHPIQEWVSGLVWDGTPRLETAFPRLLGHEEHGFDARLLRRWAVSAVARAMEPGCKVDTVLIIKAFGGVGKTKFFEALGGRWYTGSSVVPGDKDGMLVMRRFWIIEWGELDDMKRSRTAQATKRFLSLRRDDFRDPYGRDVSSSERHCVIVGSTNEQEILNDDEGGHRRFWPVEILTPDIDIRWLEQHREQLFAEALAIYRAGLGCPDCAADRDKRCGEHRWWLTKDEDALLAERHQDFTVDPHPWFNIISTWLDWPVNEGTHFVTTELVMREALAQDKGQLRGLDAKDVAKILRQLGWKKARENGRTGRRGWLRPGVLL